MEIKTFSEWWGVQESHKNYNDSVRAFMRKIFKEIEASENPTQAVEAFIRFMEADVEVLDRSVVYRSKKIPSLSVKVSFDGSSILFYVTENNVYEKLYTNNSMVRAAWMVVVLQELINKSAEKLVEVNNG